MIPCTRGHSFSRPLTTAAVEVLGPNPQRWGIIVGSDGTEDTLFGLSSVAADNPRLPGDGSPLLITKKDFGCVIEQPWFAAVAANTGTITITEVMEQ